MYTVLTSVIKIPHFLFYLYIISVSFSPPELCGYRCREESLLPVSRPLRSEQPAGSSVQSHPLEKDSEFTTCAPHSTFSSLARWSARSTYWEIHVFISFVKS